LPSVSHLWPQSGNFDSNKSISSRLAAYRHAEWSGRLLWLSETPQSVVRASIHKRILNDFKGSPMPESIMKRKRT
jgi:hypothetical protein